MNLVVLKGNISSDIKTNHSQYGPVVGFDIAVSKQTKDGKKTDFIKCVAFNKTAEAIAKYFTKGKAIAIEGELKQEQWTTKDDQKRERISVKVNRFEFCGYPPTETTSETPPDF